MTFRVEDLTISLLPNQYAVEGADCAECTKATPATVVSDCSCPSDGTAEMCDCPQCEESSEEKTAIAKGARHLEALHAQLDELLASVG